MTVEIQHWTDKLAAHRPTLSGAEGEYAVLVPLVTVDGAPHLLYEVRAVDLRHQPGEVCFPGGRLEGDETPLACALRETEEELGVSRRQITVLGPLDFQLRGQSIIYPVLALMQIGAPDALSISRREVADVFTVPLAWLQKHPPEIYRSRMDVHPADFPYETVGVSPDYPWAPSIMEVPIYRGLPYPLWGLTARITAQVVALDN